jgi:hypothetical protein
MIGAADWPIDDRWIDQRSDLLYEMRTPRQPRAIKSGDLLVYYAAGTQKFFAIARATQDGSNVPESTEPGEHRWPFRIPVQMYLAVPMSGLRVGPRSTCSARWPAVARID